MKVKTLIAMALSAMFMVTALAGCQGSGSTANSKQSEPAPSSQESGGGSGTK